MRYRVELPVFEGPMDLLLYLIKKNEIDITDIPVAIVTEQYLQYLNMMNILNVALASEFLVMAATLMFIKSRMLLPQIEDEEGGPGFAEDPRIPLVHQLLEYQHFKEISLQIEERATAEENVFSRWVPLEMIEADPSEGVETLDLFSLFRCFASVLERHAQSSMEVKRELINVEEKREELLRVMMETERLDFLEYLRHRSLAEMVAIFLALLDLVKWGKLKLMQREAFGAIEVYR